MTGSDIPVDVELDELLAGPGDAPTAPEPDGNDPPDPTAAPTADEPKRPGFFARMFGKAKQWRMPKDRRQKKAVAQERALCRNFWAIILDGVARRASKKWTATNKELDALAETSIDFVNTVAPRLLAERAAQIGLPVCLLAYIAARVELKDLGRLGRRKKAGDDNGGRDAQSLAAAGSRRHGEIDPRAPAEPVHPPTRAI